MTPITPSEPIVQPAVPEKVFDTFQITRLHIHSPVPGQDARIDLYLEAFNAATKEKSGNEIHVHIPGVFAAAQEVPELGTAAGAIYAGVKAYCKAKGLI